MLAVLQSVENDLQKSRLHRISLPGTSASAVRGYATCCGDLVRMSLSQFRRGLRLPAATHFLAHSHKRVSDCSPRWRRRGPAGRTDPRRQDAASGRGAWTTVRNASSASARTRPPCVGETCLEAVGSSDTAWSALRLFGLSTQRFVDAGRERHRPLEWCQVPRLFRGRWRSLMYSLVNYPD